MTHETGELPQGVILRAEGISISFGGIHAVQDFSFEIKRGEIYGLIGPNGAGKTTIFNMITQFYKPDCGDILFAGRENQAVNLTGLKVHEVIRHGLVRTFQNVELIPNLSLLDNLLVGAHIYFKTNFISQMLRLPKARREERELRKQALEVLHLLNLDGKADEMASGQPYGVRKKLELGRAILAQPSLLILDEPAAGLNESETVELTRTLEEVQSRFGCTILLIEHDMRLVMDICDRICAVSFGKKLAEGTPLEIQSNTAVQEAYLGKDDE